MSKWPQTPFAEHDCSFIVLIVPPFLFQVLASPFFTVSFMSFPVSCWDVCDRRLAHPSPLRFVQRHDGEDGGVAPNAVRGAGLSEPLLRRRVPPPAQLLQPRAGHALATPRERGYQEGQERALLRQGEGASRRALVDQVKEEVNRGS